MEILEPNLGMLLLVVRGLEEQGRDLLVAVLLRLASVVLVLGMSLGLTRKSSLQVDLSLATLQIHGNPLSFWIGRAMCC